VFRSPQQLVLEPRLQGQNQQQRSRRGAGATNDNCNRNGAGKIAEVTIARMGQAKRDRHPNVQRQQIHVALLPIHP